LSMAESGLSDSMLSQILGHLSLSFSLSHLSLSPYDCF
jgi:hypothetical protein